MIFSWRRLPANLSNGARLQVIYRRKNIMEVISVRGYAESVIPCVPRAALVLSDCPFEFRHSVNLPVICLVGCNIRLQVLRYDNQESCWSDFKGKIVLI